MDGESLVPFVESINKKVLSVLTQVSSNGRRDLLKLISSPTQILNSLPNSSKS